MDDQRTESSTDRTDDDGPPVEASVFLDIDADPEAVWLALTTEGGLAPWMGEGATLDPRPGGLVVLPDPVGGATRRGRVDQVEEASRLDYTWWPALRPAERTEVSITVVPNEGGCRVQVTERRPREQPAAIGVRASARRLPIGLWSWRLAVLSLSGSLSRI